MKFSVLFLGLISWGLCASEILWVRPDFPPASVIDGPMKNQGYNDRTRQFLIERMPEYRHAVQLAGYERIVRLMQQENVCIVGLYKSPEREQYIVYSQPRGLVLANGLAVRAADKSRFNAYLHEQQIMLEPLLKDDSLLAGAADGRLYKGPVDGLLAEYQKAQHVLMRSGANVFSNLLQMLALNRIDYTFGFPVELVYQQRVQHFAQEIAFIPIAGMPQATPSYVACSRNAWGEKAIADIDNILLKHRLSPAFLSAYQNWLDPQSRALHQRLSQQAFGD